MADINTLFAQATDEADAFAEEGARAHQSVDQILRLSAALGDAVEAGAAEARDRLQLLSTRLLEGEQDLTRENGAALAALASLRSASGEVRGRVDGYLALVHAQLLELREEKERLRDEMRQRGDEVQEHAGRYAARVREVESASRARLDAARQAVTSFRGMVEASRGGLYQRREVLLAMMKQMELDGRQRLDLIVQAYDGVAALVQEQLSGLQATLTALTDQAVAGLARRLSHDAVESLEKAAEPLRDAISDLERFCHDSRKVCGDRLQEITGQVEDITSVLERLRQPLEYIRQHLH
jgi:hypothetical protein